MDLIDRKYRILQAIIDDYIMTALPVGSRTISRKYEQKLSSATIRNEMSDLEELGYLDSPHTSAGRIPSYKAYRLYVDRMIHPMPLSEEETAFIKGCFDRRINQVEELSARIAKALSSMTHYTTAVMTRAPREEQVFSHLQLVPVSDRRLLLVIVTQSGAVRQTVIDTEKPIAPDALYTVSQIISRELEGCKVSGPACTRWICWWGCAAVLACVWRCISKVKTPRSTVTAWSMVLPVGEPVRILLPTSTRCSRTMSFSQKPKA